MPNKVASPKLSRRKLLINVSASGVAIAAGITIFDLRPWLDYEGQAKGIRKSLILDPQNEQQMHELVRYATLAANSHNSQPWKFKVKPNVIEIHPDYSRKLPVVDPDDRELWMSLGCALENLLIAARSQGFRCEVIYPDTSDVISVSLESDGVDTSPLLKSILSRQNNRSGYDGKEIPAKDLDHLQSVKLEPGVGLTWVLDADQLKKAADYVSQGNLAQFADKSFVNELISWIRFNKRQALATNDGLYTKCSGNPEVPGWLGRLFVSSTKSSQQAEQDAKKLLSSSGAVIITSKTEGKSQWVRAGQVYERLALTMMSRDVKTALLNQPIEMRGLRGQFQSALGLGDATPELLLRFGYAANLPMSLRRPVEDVLVQG